MLIRYFTWSDAAYRWEYLSTHARDGLMTLLTRIQRLPSQVALRDEGGETLVYARRPDVLDDQGRPRILPFAAITEADFPQLENAHKALKIAAWTYPTPLTNAEAA